MGKQPVPFLVEMLKALIFSLVGTGILTVFLISNMRPSSPTTKPAIPSRNTGMSSLSPEYLISKVALLNNLNREIDIKRAQVKQYQDATGGNFVEDRKQWEERLRLLIQDLQRERRSLPPGFFDEAKKLGLKIIADP